MLNLEQRELVEIYMAVFNDPVRWSIRVHRGRCILYIRGSKHLGWVWTSTPNMFVTGYWTVAL